jgi:TRAP-type mannitol/chloroaromatic compound transport system, small permease component
MALARAIDGLAAAVAKVAMVFLLLLVAATIYEVVARYVFNMPTLWAFDVTYMLNGAIFALGGAYTLRHRGHVRIDVLSARLPPVANTAITVAVYLGLLAPALGFMVYGTATRAYEAFLTGEVENASAWGPRVWPFFSVLLLGMICLLLQVLLEAARSVGNLVRK